MPDNTAQSPIRNFTDIEVEILVFYIRGKYMDPIETKCIEIFQLIDWKSIGKGEDYGIYHALIVEFWRRAAKFAKFHGTANHTPWDVAQSAFPNLHYSAEALSVVVQFAAGVPKSAEPMLIRAMLNYILFEKARDQGLVPLQERNIYSPIIKLCQLQGAFYMHHGMMELGDLRQISFDRQGWKQFADRDVILDMDDDFNILSRP